MAQRFFDPETPLWRPLGLVGELVMLSLLWGLCSIPLLTLGPAAAALYDTAEHSLRRREEGLFSRFFGAFRRALRTGVPATLLWAAPLLALYGLLRLLSGRLAAESLLSPALAFLLALTALLLLMLGCWLFPLLSRFAPDLRRLFGAALGLVLTRPLRSLVLAVSLLVFALPCWLFTTPLIFLPGALALLWTRLIEPVFRELEDEART